MTDLTIPEALDKLASEGDADQIAAHLRRLGIRGAWESDVAPLTCPVSRYVRAETGEVVQVTRSGWGVYGDFFTGGVLPVAVREFVKRFDGKSYPELIEAGTDG